MGMSKPARKYTKSVPNGNLFGPVNHFRFWGSIIIATGGLVAGYFYFITTSDFTSNSDPVVIKKWNPLTASATCMFLIILTPYALYSVFFYIGEPWKQKMYKNWILFPLVILNVMSTVALHYITSYARKFLGLVAVSYSVASTLLLI